MTNATEMAFVSNMEVKPFARIPLAEKPSLVEKSNISSREKERQNWGFVFSHASRSSKSILVALQWLHRLSPYESFGAGHLGTDWLVGEMVEWLKGYIGIALIQETLEEF